MEDDDDGELDEELVAKAIRIREQRLREAQTLHEYRQKLKETTLKTFTDRPEPVSSLKIVNATPCALMVEWTEPDSNNS